jgi:U3 small nucleolar RNA-associated protein 21
LMVSCSLDGRVIVWKFPPHRSVSVGSAILHQIDLNHQISRMIASFANDLVAIACDDDFCIRLLDVSSAAPSVVRCFEGHTNRITDMTFSPDGRWLISASLDRSIRCWDLPSGHMIDAFLCRSICTSVAFSPAGDQMVTAHHNSLGVHLWVNKRLFTHVPLAPLPLDYIPEEFHENLYKPFSDDSDDSDSSESADDNGLNVVPMVEEVNELQDLEHDLDLLMLSDQPRTKWHNLLNIETIKKRNRPVKPPTAPEKAPFFLPTIAGLEPKFKPNGNDKGDDKGEDDAYIADIGAESSSKIFKMGMFDADTGLNCQIKAFADMKNSSAELLEYVKSLSPTALDFELRSIPTISASAELTGDGGDPLFISPVDGSGDDEEIKEEKSLLLWFLEALVDLLKSKRDFELVQAYFLAGIKIYSDIIVSDVHKFKSVLIAYEQVVNDSWKSLDQRMQFALCALDYIRK